MLTFRILTKEQAEAAQASLDLRYDYQHPDGAKQIEAEDLYAAAASRDEAEEEIDQIRADRRAAMGRLFKDDEGFDDAIGSLADCQAGF
jgi:hypothetical protein